MTTDLSQHQIEEAERHIAYEGNVDLVKWIDTSSHGFKITLGLSNRNQLDFFDGVMTMRKSRGGQRYHAILQPYVTDIDHGRHPDPESQVQQEWQFCGRGWSESSGAHIAVHIGDRTTIAYWRQQKAGDQVEAEKRGQLFYVMLLELQDDETIVNQEFRSRVVEPPAPKGGPRSKAVARLIADPEFAQWMNYASIHNCGPQGSRDVKERDAYVKFTIGIGSKIELDNGNESAWQAWETQFHRPFIQYMQRNGR